MPLRGELCFGALGAVPARRQDPGGRGEQHRGARRQPERRQRAADSVGGADRLELDHQWVVMPIGPRRAAGRWPRRSTVVTKVRAVMVVEGSGRRAEVAVIRRRRPLGRTAWRSASASTGMIEGRPARARVDHAHAAASRRGRADLRVRIAKQRRSGIDDHALAVEKADVHHAERAVGVERRLQDRRRDRRIGLLALTHGQLGFETMQETDPLALADEADRRPCVAVRQRRADHQQRTQDQRHAERPDALQEPSKSG